MIEKTFPLFVEQGGTRFGAPTGAVPTATVAAGKQDDAPGPQRTTRGR